MPLELFAIGAVAVGLVWATWLCIRGVDRVPPRVRPSAAPVDRGREDGLPP